MLLETYRPDLSQALVSEGAPAYRHVQVYEHLFRRPLRLFAEATALPTGTRDDLDALGVSTLTRAGSRTAPDGTTKVLLSAHDGLSVETVIMTYGRRVAACVSTQVGCPVGCVFCATGGMGFARNLSAAEIVDQVRVAWVHAADLGRRVSNLVYMGMGEPLLNLGAVLDSIRILTDPAGLGLAHRAISVSTVGIPAGMVRLGRAEPQVNLAVSLHAADDRTRALLVPEAHRHPISDILTAAWEHFALTHRKLLVEYVLLRDVNDTADDARRLASLLRGHVVTVNLLTWNAVPRSARRATQAPRDLATMSRSVPQSPAVPFRPSPQATVHAFRDTLIASGVEAVIRRSKGGDIQAACGQLAARRGSYLQDPAL